MLLTQRVMKKLFHLKHDGRLFLVFAKHDIQLAHAGALFVSAFMTQEQADAVNRDFPGTAFSD